MMKYLLNILISMMILSSVNAQKVSLSMVDAQTYEYYQKGQWDELIKLGKQALRQNIDFYYLQLRMGAAYFEKEKYFKAAQFYQKAYDQNPDDAYTAESLYLSYLRSGQYAAADKVSEHFKAEQKHRLSIEETPAVAGLDLTYKYVMTDDYAQNDLSGALEQTVMQDAHYLGIGLRHKIQGEHQIFHAYSNFSMLNLKYDISNMDTPPSYYEQVKQNQYYFRWSYHGDPHWDYTLAGHYLNLKITGETEFIRPRRLNYLYSFTQHGYLLNGGLGKQLGVFYTEWDASWLDLEADRQFQTGIGIVWYPLANRSLAFKFRADYWQQLDTAVNPERSAVLSPALGWYMADRFYIQPSAQFGKARNFLEQNGFVVNNHPDPVVSKYRLLMRLNSKSEKFYFFMQYEYETSEGNYTLNNEPYQLEYNNQSITGGISWYF